MTDQIEACNARAVGGKCVMPAGHNRGQIDIPSNHSAISDVSVETAIDFAEDYIYLKSKGIVSDEESLTSHDADTVMLTLLQAVKAQQSELKKLKEEKLVVKTQRNGLAQTAHRLSESIIKIRKAVSSDIPAESKVELIDSALEEEAHQAFAALTSSPINEDELSTIRLLLAEKAIAPLSWN